MGWPSAAMLLLVVALLCVAALGPLAAEAAAATKQPAKFESTKITTALPASTAAKLRAAPADDDGKNDVQDRPVTSGVELEDYDDAADELPSTDLKARTEHLRGSGFFALRKGCRVDYFFHHHDGVFDHRIHYHRINYNRVNNHRVHHYRINDYGVYNNGVHYHGKHDNRNDEYRNINDRVFYCFF
ncbi:hypothetical protein MTO96_006203 [Rhipicephalus appendiculatus]